MPGKRRRSDDVSRPLLRESAERMARFLSGIRELRRALDAGPSSGEERTAFTQRMLAGLENLFDRTDTARSKGRPSKLLPAFRRSEGRPPKLTKHEERDWLVRLERHRQNHDEQPAEQNRQRERLSWDDAISLEAMPWLTDLYIGHGSPPDVAQALAAAHLAAILPRLKSQRLRASKRLR